MRAHWPARNLNETFLVVPQTPGKAARISVRHSLIEAWFNQTRSASFLLPLSRLCYSERRAYASGETRLFVANTPVRRSHATAPC